MPLLRAGPLGAVVTRGHGPFGFAWLVAGTVTDETLLTRGVRPGHRGQVPR